MSNFTDFFPQGSPIRGETLFTAVGTHIFYIPEGVTSVSMVAIGGGGSGGGTGSNASGGGGGALAYANNINVENDTYLVVYVGAGGVHVGLADNNGRSGTASYVYPQSLGSGSKIVNAGGGNTNGTGGAVITGSGGAGGTGFLSPYNSYGAGSGGASGGYTSKGANGAGQHLTNKVYNTASTGNTGAGGSGGSGGMYIGSSFSTCRIGGSSGTCLYGLGTNGTGGSANSTSANGGNPGSAVTGTTFSVCSGKVSGTSSLLGYAEGIGESNGFGSGGGHHLNGYNLVKCSRGSNGGVRIIWGEGRAFPSTNCGV